jgi:8-oxo-dGTP pyrophosphatase MutT (NUDIX family)
MSKKLLKTFIKEVLEGGIAVTGSSDSGRTDQRTDDRLTHSQQNSSVLDDEENEDEQKDEKSLRAACCLIVAPDNTILAVSRKNNPSDFGLPGGKVDPGESFKQAAARELQEETGLYATSLNMVFKAKDKSGYVTATFATEVSGEVDTDETGVVRWVKPADLLNGMFADYNKALFTRLGIKA